MDELLPLATVITPNLPEARVLAGRHDDAEQLVRALHALGPAAVVLTGGHRDEATDLFFDGTDWCRSRASATRTARRTARAARTRPRSPRISRSGSPRWRRRGPPARSPAPPCGTACAGLGAGAGPVDVFELTARTAVRAVGAPGPRAGGAPRDIIAP